MFDLNTIIENIFLNKKADIQKEYEEKLSEAENEKKIISFIVDDIEKGIVFGAKYENKIKYELKKVLKEIKINESNCLSVNSCVSTLKGLGFQAEKEISTSISIIIYNLNL